MNDFILHNPTKIIFGKSSMEKLSENVKPFGNKVLLTYGKGSIRKNGIYEKVISELKDFEVVEFGGIEPNPRVETIRKAVLEFKDYNPDLILAVGGGSVIDGSKLLASALHYSGDAWDFLVNPDVNPTKYVPLAVVLTMSATGSEMNCGSVITNWETKEKPFFTRTPLYPKFSILDPQNTFSLPKDQTAYGVVDAFSHVLEQYINTSLDTPLQDRFCEGILLTLIENGPKALKNPNDYDARANIMFSATMALNDLLASGVNQDWATHGIEHELSAFYDMPHGAGLAIITPRWMEVVGLTQKMDKMAQYGKRVWGLSGQKEKVAKEAIQKTFNFFKDMGIKMQLKDWKIDKENFEVMIERLEKNKIGEVPLTKIQITKILQLSL